MNKKLIKVVLLFGGKSSEHEVSISSARNVYTALDKAKFQITNVFIDKKGQWWLVDNFDQIKDYSKMSQLAAIPGNKSLVNLSTGERITPDVILPILHGENGEDGAVQGFSQILDIPIVGCDIAASAICMDKELTKELLEYNGVKTTPYMMYYSGTPELSYDDVAKRLGEVVFIKPAGCGSSVGVSKVKNASGFHIAIAKALKYDNKVLIEKAITARELEVAILGSNNDAQASCVGEIIADSEFYDYDSKYSQNSQSRTVIPAEINGKVSEEIRTIAVKAFKILGCNGLSRIDFFLSDKGEVLLNEVNTLPGFTDISMYPKLWQNKGVKYSELLERLISIRLGR